jgi:hypothetical protein
MLLTYKVWACVHTQGADLINSIFNAAKFILLLLVVPYTIGIAAFVGGVLMYETHPTLGLLLGAGGMLVALTADLD